MVQSEQFDLVVLGSGPAATGVATSARDQGRSVALIDCREIGGTCALRGCNPKKVYTNAANLLARVEGSYGQLSRFRSDQHQWSDLLSFKQQFTEPVRQGKAVSLQEKGITVLRGTAYFVDERTIGVACDRLGDEKGHRLLNAERVLIATGSEPRDLQMPGAEHVMTSDEFLECEDLPRRVVFIGGGYISMEFAHAAVRYGRSVTILERNERVLEQFDPDLVHQLMEYSCGCGCMIQTDCNVCSVQQEEDGTFTVTYETADGSERVAADVVVHGAGRVPNIGRLRLDCGQVAYSERGVEVNQYLQSTSNSRVFAAGDCADTGRPALTPVANAEADAVVENLFATSLRATADVEAIATVAFTAPPIARVGLSEQQVRETIGDVIINHHDTSAWGSIRKMGGGCGGYKVLIDPLTRTVAGAHLLGPRADEQVNLFTLAVRHRLTVEQLMSTRFAFPTHGHDLRRML